MSEKNIVFRHVFLFCFSLFLAGKVDNIEFPKKEIDQKTSVATKNDRKEPKAWNCELVNACDDKLGFEAILTLHQRLDDDADGNIDIVESDEVKESVEGERNADVAKAFEIPLSSLSTILKNKEKIFSASLRVE
ncbi:stromal interaction molecule [Trichonephila clavipes]|nr:stromal interaction molecule [Trichonephila clavipes]